MMFIDNEFSIKQVVYLKTDVEQRERLVTGINIRETSISYELTCGTESSDHYGFEVNEDKDVIMITNN